MKTEILRLDNVSMQMSGIMQLERFNLQIFSGEIMGLMALNAHGVSSLVSLLQSNTPVHFGRVYYCEQLVNSHIYSRTTPNEIVVIEQKSHLVNGLTVGDNVFVLSGVERRWLLHTQSFRGRLQELEQAVGVDIPCNRQVEELSLFERCMVELLKAWESGARLVLLWNISHFLAGTDIGRLHYAIRHFASRGMAFIYISNSYEELCGQRLQLRKRPVQTEIRHDIGKVVSFQLLPQLRKPGQNLRRRRDKIEPGVMLFQICQQQLGVDNHTVLRSGRIRKRAAQRVAWMVYQMLGAQKAVAERQPGRDAKVLHQRQYLLRARSAGTDAPAAPDAAFRCAVDGSNLAPIVKIRPVRPVKRQKCVVELVKFK